MATPPKFVRHAHAAWLLLALSLAGCTHSMAGFKFRPRGVHERETRCARAVMGRNSPYRVPLADPLRDEEGLKLLSILPAEARRTARAAGLEPVIATLLQRKSDSEPPANDLLLRYQELAMRLTAFDAQVDSLAFEVGCTRERLVDLLRTLDGEESSRQLMLAGGSLIIGATTGTVAGVWDLTGPRSTVPAWAAVAGGVVTAAFGAAALLVPERVVLLEHQQNLLRPIIEGKDPDHLYSSFVFRMLTTHFPGDEGVPRDALMRDLELILSRKMPGEKHDRALQILAGTGSYYPRELLEAREEFLHAVEVSVAGVARELELLDRTVVRLFATPPAPPPKGWP